MLAPDLAHHRRLVLWIISEEKDEAFDFEFAETAGIVGETEGP